MTNDEIVTDILLREGGLVDDPLDHGGLTFAGVSKVSHPELWVNGPPSMEQVKQLYLERYIKGPGFDQIPASHDALKHQLVDFGVNSGPMIAIMSLQRVLGASQDGKIGSKTLSALTDSDVRYVNNKLVKERVMMFARICKKAPSQVRFLSGWLDRALSFLI